MTEYKSKYINKTWDEITTSFDWVNCQPIRWMKNITIWEKK
ncbi:hypothetical protein [Spiroplasma sp. ChiS]|nr:hypothetical protein [Spiroplasma sp. ChiS]